MHSLVWLSRKLIIEIISVADAMHHVHTHALPYVD